MASEWLPACFDFSSSFLSPLSLFFFFLFSSTHFVPRSEYSFVATFRSTSFFFSTAFAALPLVLKSLLTSLLLLLLELSKVALSIPSLVIMSGGLFNRYDTPFNPFSFAPSREDVLARATDLHSVAADGGAVDANVDVDVDVDVNGNGGRDRDAYDAMDIDPVPDLNHDFVGAGRVAGATTDATGGGAAGNFFGTATENAFDTAAGGIFGEIAAPYIPQPNCIGTATGYNLAGAGRAPDAAGNHFGTANGNAFDTTGGNFGEVGASFIPSQRNHFGTAIENSFDIGRTAGAAGNYFGTATQNAPNTAGGIFGEAGAPFVPSQRAPLSPTRGPFGKRRPLRQNRPVKYRAPIGLEARPDYVSRSAKNTLFKPPSPYRRHPFGSALPFIDRTRGRGYFTSYANRDRALLHSTLGASSARARYYNHDFDHLAHFPPQNSLLRTNYGTANNPFNPFVPPSGFALPSSMLTRKRPLDDVGRSGSTSRPVLRIDPPAVRERRRREMFGGKKPWEVARPASTSLANTKPRTPASAKLQDPTGWTPARQLLHGITSAAETKDDYVPGTFPTTPLVESASGSTQGAAATDNQPQVTNEDYVMSGALPESPNNASPRARVPISPVGTVIPADYSRESENSQLQRAETLHEQHSQTAEPSDDTHNAQPADTANSYGWYGAAAAYALNYAASFAGSVKRRAVGLFTRPRPSVPDGTSASPRRTHSRSLRSRGGERSHQSQSGEYPFPDMTHIVPCSPRGERRQSPDLAPTPRDDASPGLVETDSRPESSSVQRVEDSVQESQSQDGIKSPAADNYLCFCASNTN